MAKFTSSEANASEVIDATEEKEGLTFKQWTFTIKDTVGNYYDWSDTNADLLYASAPKGTEIQTYIHNYLTGGAKADGSGNYTGVDKISGKRIIRNPKVFRSLINKKVNATVTPDIGIVTYPNNDTVLDQQGYPSKQVVKTTTVFKTFASGDATPSVYGSNYFNTHTGTLTITDFDEAVNMQKIIVVSKGAITFDVTSSGLIGGSTNIVTASGDVTEWIYLEYKWYLRNFLDISTNLTGGH